MNKTTRLATTDGPHPFHPEFLPRNRPSPYFCCPLCLPAGGRHCFGPRKLLDAQLPRWGASHTAAVGYLFLMVKCLKVHCFLEWAHAHEDRVLITRTKVCALPLSVALLNLFQVFGPLDLRENPQHMFCNNKNG